MGFLHVADWTALVLFFVCLLSIGAWESRKVRNSVEYFMPRKFGKLMMITFAFGTGTSTEQAVGVASKSFTNGLSGIWYQWAFLPITPIYWLVGGLFRRFRATTTADVYEARYDASVAILYAVVGALTVMVSLGVVLKGSGEVLSGCVGGAISPNMIILGMTIVFGTYGVAGGLSAAIITDFVQGILIILFSFMLLPSILSSVGGLDGLRSSISDPSMLSLVAPQEIGVFFVTVIAINGLIGVISGPNVMAMCGAGRTEIEGRYGLMGGNIVKRVCTVAWTFIGLCGAVYYSGKTVHPDTIFGRVAADFLPKIMPGLLGIFIAGALAAVMAATSGLMISSSALITENMYKRLVKNKSSQHYVAVARVACIFVVIFALLFAFWVPNVIVALEVSWKIAQMGPALVLGLFWRRTTVPGAWASVLVSFAAWWVTTLTPVIHWVQSLPFSESLKFTMERSTGLEVYLPWQMLFYLVAGFAAGMIVSLFTKPVDPVKLDKFYALMRTPVTLGEKVLAPCTLPVEAVVPPKRVIFPNTQWEILVPSRVTVMGFLAGLLIVSLMVYALYWLVTP